MNYWNWGNTWSDTTLATEARANSALSRTITDDGNAVMGARSPLWVGTAADVARVDRETMDGSTRWPRRRMAPSRTTTPSTT